MKVAEALSILGNPSQGKEAVSKAYREKAKEYHPDRANGDLELMKLVNLAYETLEKVGFKWSSEDRETGKCSTPLTETMQDLWNSVKHYPGIKGELIGTWLWITGNTYPYRKHLKELGFQFAKHKKAWYYHEGSYYKLSHRKFELEEIRNLWGSQELETEESFTGHAIPASV